MNTTTLLKRAGRLVVAAWLLATPLTLPAQQLRLAKPDLMAAGFQREASAATVSPVEILPCSGSVGVLDGTQREWRTQVINREKGHRLSPELMALKAQKTQQKLQDAALKMSATENAASALAPVVGTTFDGNWCDGFTPSDNAMAISNGGKIVTTVNSNIEYYTTSGQVLYSKSFADFFSNPSFTGSLYDPKITYDPQADRFIMTVLHGTTSATSLVLLLVSKTNDPMDGWWYYSLDGTLTPGTWFDYPSIGISANEIYITGNSFTDAGVFSQAVIFQIQKAPCLSGGTINYQSWTNISATPFTAFTLVPVTPAQGQAFGPGTYFVCSSSSGSDKIRLFDLTKDLGQNPQLNSYSFTVPAYSPGGYALQQGSGVQLNTGDCRMQSALILNNVLHFAFHADLQGGYNGLYYGRIDLTSNSVSTQRFGASGFDYCYPFLASASSSASDQTVAIGFQRSGSSIYPEFRVTECDNGMSFANSSLIKAGSSYVDISASANNARWGDYTSAARRYGSNPTEVWVAGGFGTTRTLQGNLYHCYDTWIGEVGFNATGIEETPQTVQRMQVYPNPVVDLFTLDFEVEKSVNAEIVVTDIMGRPVKLLYHDLVKKGRNTLAFNKAALPAGTYFVTVRTQQTVLKNEKIVIL